jgi:uncharacterized protein YndB with AHSA1/START domain
MAEVYQYIENRMMDLEFSSWRLIEAPTEMLWSALTVKENLKQWFAPTDWSWAGSTLDLRRGGIFHYRLKSSAGELCWGRFEFQQICAPTHLTGVFSFADPTGSILRHPGNRHWPLEMKCAIVLETIDKSTKISLGITPICRNDVERAAFEAGAAAIDRVLESALSRLVEHLAGRAQLG